MYVLFIDSECQGYGFRATLKDDLTWSSKYANIDVEAEHLQKTCGDLDLGFRDLGVARATNATLRKNIGQLFGNDLLC